MCARGKRLLLLGAAFIVMGSAARGLAQGPIFDLEWNAPPECPPRESVLAEIARVLGPASASVPFRARAVVVHDESGRYRGDLEVEARGVQSRRELVGETCDTIASAAALIVGIAIEGDAVLARAHALGNALAPASAPSATSRAEAAAPPSTKEGPEHREGQPQRERPASGAMIVAAGAMLDGTTMPSVAAGGELTLGWAYLAPRWRARVVAGGLFFPTQGKAANVQGEGGDFTLVGATARACLSLATARFDAGPCVGGELDHMDASGTGPILQQGEAGANWASFTGSALGAWHMSPAWDLLARFDVVVSGSQPQFIIAQPNMALVVHQPALATIRGVLGLEVHIF
jgi:hypothetical protein